MKDLNKLLMNPIRMRIFQYASTHKNFKAGDLVGFMKDIPRTTLYRHLNLLFENKILSVVGENKIRGTLEKIYTLNLEELKSQNTLENAPENSFNFLMKLYGDFQQYFSNPNIDPTNDRLFLTMVTLLLNDEEYDNFLKEINSIVGKYINNETTKDRKSRNISIISSPNME